MARDRTDLQDQLHAIAEQLADEAMVLLREAMRAADDGERAARRAEEKRVTRARRAVEKAAALLAGGEPDRDD